MTYQQAGAAAALNASGIPSRFRQDPEPIVGREPDLVEWDRLLGEARRLLHDQPGCVLCIVGPYGTGKTAMACRLLRDHHMRHGELAARVDRQRRANHARYRKARAIMSDLTASFGANGKGSERDTFKALARVSLLAIDEMGRRRGSEYESDVLTDLIDERISEGRSTILLSNQTRDEMLASISDAASDRVRQTRGFVQFGHASFRTGGVV